MASRVAAPLVGGMMLCRAGEFRPEYSTKQYVENSAYLAYVHTSPCAHDSCKVSTIRQITNVSRHTKIRNIYGCSNPVQPPSLEVQFPFLSWFSPLLKPSLDRGYT